MARSTWKLTAEQKAEVVTLYTVAGQGTTQIGQHFGVTGDAIRLLLRNRGIATPRPGKLSAEQKADAVQRYIAGENTTQLAAAMGVSAASISWTLHRCGVVMRRPRETSTTCLVRHNAFDVLTPDAAYWCGFIFADGSTHLRPDRTPQLAVGLSECDRGHLVKLRTFLGSTHTIGFRPAQTNGNGYTSKPQCRLSVTSERLVTRLHVLGRYEGPIAAELAASRHFWRGVVDGDGSLGYYRRRGHPNWARQPTFSLVGSRRLLEGFSRFLVIGGATPASLPLRPHCRDCSSLQNRTTHGPAGRIITLLYQDAPIALDRKAAKAQEIQALRAAIA